MFLTSSTLSCPCFCAAQTPLTKRRETRLVPTASAAWVRPTCYSLDSLLHPVLVGRFMCQTACCNNNTLSSGAVCSHSRRQQRRGSQCRRRGDQGQHALPHPSAPDAAERRRYAHACGMISCANFDTQSRPLHRNATMTTPTKLHAGWCIRMPHLFQVPARRQSRWLTGLPRRRRNRSVLCQSPATVSVAACRHPRPARLQPPCRPRQPQVQAHP